MEIYDRKTAPKVSERWRQQYQYQGKWTEVTTKSKMTSKEIYEAVLTAEAFGGPEMWNAIDAAIGNTCWTTCACDSCNEPTTEPMISFDMTGGYGGSNDKRICKKCLKKAVRKLRKYGK